MATEVAIRLRQGEPVRVTFEDEEDWRIEDRDKLVFVLGSEKVVRAVVNLTDFICAVVTEGGDGG